MRTLFLQDQYHNMRQSSSLCAFYPPVPVSLGFHVGEIALMSIYEDLWLFYRSKKAEINIKHEEYIVKPPLKLLMEQTDDVY